MAASCRTIERLMGSARAQRGLQGDTGRVGMPVQLMSILQRAGLVESTRIGPWTYYRRSDARVAQLPQLLGDTL